MSSFADRALRKRVELLIGELRKRGICLIEGPQAALRCAPLRTDAIHLVTMYARAGGGVADRSHVGTPAEFKGTPLGVTRPRAEAANPQNESLFTVRAALKRALAIRRDAELQVEQLRALVARLEENR